MNTKLTKKNEKKVVEFIKLLMSQQKKKEKQNEGMVSPKL